MATGKMRIMLRGYDAPLLEQATEQILDAATRTGAQISGPVPMPTRRRRFTVIRSPHITKDSPRTLRALAAQAPRRHRGTQFQDDGCFAEIERPERRGGQR